MLVGLRFSAALLAMLASTSPLCAGRDFAVSGSVRSASGALLAGVAVTRAVFVGLDLKL